MIKERKTIDDYEIGDRFITDDTWGHGEIIEIERKTKTQLVMNNGYKYKPHMDSNYIRIIGGGTSYAWFATKELIDKRNQQILAHVFHRRIKWQEMSLDQLTRVNNIINEGKND